MSTVRARVDPDLKDAAEATFRQLGLDMTAGIKLFLTQVVLQGGVPFDVKLPSPNKQTLRAIAASYNNEVESVGSVDELIGSVENA